jgi:hypothetical protein
MRHFSAYHSSAVHLLVFLAALCNEGTSANDVDTAFEITNPLETSDWNERVLAGPGHCVFHSREWAAVLHETYGFTPGYFVRYSGGKRLTALGAFMEASSPIAGRRGVSLPYSDFCGVIPGNEESGQELLDAVVRFGGRRGWKYAEFRSDSLRVPGAVPAVLYKAHCLDLTGGSSSVFDRFKQEVRTAIRKAEKCGVDTQESCTPEAVETYYRLHCRTRRRHGLPPQPLQFFRNVQKHILQEGRGRLVLARHKGETVAGGVFLHFGQRSMLKYAASVRASHPIRSNNLVMWHAIRSYADEGFASICFGRTSPGNTGLRQFKRSFGAREIEVPYFRYDIRGRAFVRSRDRVFGWHNALFRALPVPLLRAIGSVAYRHGS